MSLRSDILRILDNPENMSQHGRRSYWTDQIILMVRQDAVQRVEALPVGGPEGELEWPEGILPGATVVKAAAIAAIKGE